MSKVESRPYIYYWALSNELFTTDEPPPKGKENQKLTVKWTFPGDKNPILELEHVYYIGEL